MDQVGQAQDRVVRLRALLERVRRERDWVRSLDGPAGAVGAPGLWTGSAADRLHRDELAPSAVRLRVGLERAEQSVLDELGRATRVASAAQGAADGSRGSAW